MQYYHQDHLSVRTMTDSSGNVIGQQGHYPFGESWYETGTTTKWMFTTYERDSESGNAPFASRTGLRDDYAMARYNVNRLGRFASPDLLAGSRSDPQSLNRYAYALNDPLNFVDPLGLDCNWWNRDTPECENGSQGSFDWWNLYGGWDTRNAGVLEESGGTDEAGLTGCVPIRFPGLVYGPADPGHGGGGGDPIKKALEKLQDLLKLDKKCTGFLDSKKGDVLGDVGTLLQFGAFGATAIPPTQNPDGTTTAVNAASGGYIQGQAITVNANGAFFNSTFNGAPLTEDRGRIRGGTDAAQGFILLHEMGHIEDVLVPDAGNQKLVDQNNKSLEKNCKKTIDALKGGGGD